MKRDFFSFLLEEGGSVGIRWIISRGVGSGGEGVNVWVRGFLLRGVREGMGREG